MNLKWRRVIGLGATFVIPYLIGRTSTSGINRGFESPAIRQFIGMRVTIYGDRTHDFGTFGAVGSSYPDGSVGRIRLDALCNAYGIS